VAAGTQLGTPSTRGRGPLWRGGAGKGLDTTRELRPSLIAIAAASHALDALYGELRDLTLPAETAEK
jgi:hypothetical protein